jgi:hypothetical protein
MISSTAEAVLQLIRKEVDNSYQVELPKATDWESVSEQASAQGVHGICLEAIEQLPAGTIPQETLLQWIGLSELQRNQYEQTWKVACKLDKLWKTEGIHAMVLKGRSVAQYYSVPHHRYSCDLDVFIERDWVKACKLLESKGISLEYEVYKEVEFTIDNVYVECHRYITPVRGNKHLQAFERYLRGLLEGSRVQDVQGRCFENTTLVCPPLMFTVMLYVEHALGDFLHGHLSLKHIVDWVVLRKQGFDRGAFESCCKEFKFDSFLKLIDALADVVEGKIEYNELSTAHRDAFDEVFLIPDVSKPRTWFRRRVDLFFDIVNNGKKFRDYGYMSMPAFLFNSVWTHFFNKEVKLK